MYMELEVLRISSQADSTSGILFDITGGKRKFLCYTVEDEYRSTKVKHETRIPAGVYNLTLRTEGGFHSRYLKKYGPEFHKGMIYVNNVPNFEWILWHTGNSDESTSGCLILGQTQESNLVKKDGWVGSSVSAYKFVYPRVRDAILSGTKVTVKYVDFDDNGDNEYIAVSGREPVVSTSPMDKKEVKQKTQVYDFSAVPVFYGPFMYKRPMQKHKNIKLWQKKVGISSDGWFGRGTEAKVKEVQKKLGLGETGLLDEETWKLTFAIKEEQ